MTRKEEANLRAVLSVAHHDFEKGLNARAYFKVSDHALGQDLVQDTFLKTWKYLVKGGKIDLMKAFLYHVLNNLIVDEYRKNKPISLDKMLKKGFEPCTDSAARLLNILDGKSAVLLIAQLPLTYQKVLRMKYIQDLSLQEMSLITGHTKNALAVQIHRGTVRLKRLHEHGIEHPKTHSKR